MVGSADDPGTCTKAESTEVPDILRVAESASDQLGKHDDVTIIGGVEVTKGLAGRAKIGVAVRIPRRRLHEDHGQEGPRRAIHDGHGAARLNRSMPRSRMNG